MAQILAQSFTAAGQPDAPASGNPGAASYLGIYDLVGSCVSINGGYFSLTNAPSNQAGVQFSHQPTGSGGALLAAQDGGRLEIDYNPSPGTPGGVGTGSQATFWLNAQAGSANSGGYYLTFNPRNGDNLTSLGLNRQGDTPSGKFFRDWAPRGWGDLRVIFEAVYAGPIPGGGGGFMDLYFEIQDKLAGNAVLQSGRALIDSRHPNASGSLYPAGCAAISGFYPSFGLVNVYANANTGALVVNRDPWCAERGKTALRLAGQVGWSGVGSITYRGQYRVQGAGSWTDVPVSTYETGTSPTTVIHGLTPGTYYEYRRLTSDGTTTLTSATVTAKTLAPGRLSLGVGCFGDSFTGGQGGAQQPYDRALALQTAFTALGIETTEQIQNAGEGGITTDTMQSYWPYAVAQVNEVGWELADCQITTNDSGNHATGAHIQAELEIFSSHVNGAGCHVVYHQPPWRPIGDSAANTLLSVDYPAAWANLAGLHALTHVGDTTNYATGQAGAANLYADGIHYNALGAAGAGTAQAGADRTILFAIYPAASHEFSPLASLVDINWSPVR